jgi:serine/threonine protein phosphatase PrpC
MDPLADTIELNLAGDFEKLAAKHFGPGAAPMRVTFGALTDPGKVRKNNEDHYGVVQRHRAREVLLTNLPEGFFPTSREESYTMIIADGMGGAAFGEKASSLAIRTAWEMTSKAFNWYFQVNEHEAEEVLEQLRVYGKRIHQSLIEQAQGTPELDGMGSTITGVMLIGNDAFIGHVGDSRAYLFRGGSLRQVTRDHTQAQQLVDAGIYASVADAPRSMRHTLVNCLGGNEHDVRVETHRVPLEERDRLLLCTDGLSDMVTDAEIASILAKYPLPMDACQALVNSALDHGGKDNVTVVVACFEAA